MFICFVKFLQIICLLILIKNILIIKLKVNKSFYFVYLKFFIDLFLI